MALPRTPAQSYAAAVHVVQGRALCLHPLLHLLCRICASYASLERTLPVWVAWGYLSACWGGGRMGMQAR